MNKTDQVEFRRLGQQLDVGTTTVDAGLEVHLVPDHTKTNNLHTIYLVFCCCCFKTSPCLRFLHGRPAECQDEEAVSSRT